MKIFRDAHEERRRDRTRRPPTGRESLPRGQTGGTTLAQAPAPLHRQP
eukprot:CAMPEP_0197878900 /NCGR_PEP_ID=MMETSP1439-20131203/7151_1 /TAXON_ID=66791 /ORGANISM="Gonyaulax spinifera, Strain CCMP409" /LENGTH=47 /DNA_ID= /DNA_START= /DNA_END= /DNA_ORIENTATION=